ncbi:MAG: STAS domain-containing protein [Chloroflexota bacterium]
MSTLKADLISNDTTWILKLNGNIDSTTSHLMWGFSDSTKLLNALLEANIHHLVIDLSEVDNIDSHALRLMLNAYKEFTVKKVGIELHKPRPHLRRLLRIMQFDRLFTVNDNFVVQR